jgi:flagellar motor switch protein FliN/FliY
VVSPRVEKEILMTCFEELRAQRDIAFACAAALEASLGNDTLLTIGQARSSLSDVVHLEAARAVASVIDSEDASVVLFMVDAFATALERAATDELMLTAAAPAVLATLDVLGPIAGLDDDRFSVPKELPTNEAVDTLGTDVVVFPILETTDVVACLAVTFAAEGAAGEQPARAGVRAPAAPSSRTDNDLVLPGASSLVLADVEMGVTAELGRCHMTIREVLSLTAGAVIDLDRAAGTPVDLLVNGTAIARGEVVVVDEEFGIRITEILSNQGSS